MQKRKVLITGAAGFLGSHLCDRLFKDGYKVIGMDNLSTGSLGNIEHLFGHADFQFVRQDVNQPIRVEGNLDQILHFASSTTPTDDPKMLLSTMKVSSIGVRNLLGLARAKGARILMASTSQTPQETYDAAMRFQEAQLMAYQRAYGVETQIARIFNTYGPRLRLRDPRVLPSFIRQALLGEDLTVFGDGQQVRCFCFVDDVAEAIVRLLKSDYCLPLNIGNPEEVSILELAREVQLLSGKGLGIEFQPRPENDPQRSDPDITKAREILGWEPQVSRQAGLIKTYAYFEQIYQQAHN